MHIASIDIDLGKTNFHLVALGERNKNLFRKKFSRSQLLAYVPRQHSTGSKQKLYGISQRGNVPLRRMLIHGARSPARYCSASSMTPKGSGSGCIG